MKSGQLTILAACALFAASLFAGAKPKYVFVFIGDGMSTPQRMVAEDFAEKTGYGELAMNRLPYQANTRTKSANSIITDSAAAGTAIACGVKTGNSMLGVTKDGERVESVAEVAKRRGMKVGIMTTTTIVHATPASFYAHQRNRRDLYRVGLDLVESGFDYFAGGGFGGKEDDKRDEKYRGNLYDVARKAGYAVATDIDGWKAFANGAKCLATFGDTHLGFAIDKEPTRPTLAEMLKKGIEVLDNPVGFFIMCEGGTLDFAGHANDAATNLREVLALDEAVKVALAFADRHPGETLVVTTGDHETGGMSMGFAGTGGKFHVERLAGQNMSTEKFSNMIKAMLKENIDLPFSAVQPLVAEKYGLVFDGADKNDPMQVTAAELKILKDAFEKDRSFVKIRLADTKAHDVRRRYVFASAARGVLAAHAGVGWSSASHTALPTMTTAKGVGAEVLVGMAENSDIGARLKKLLSE